MGAIIGVQYGDKSIKLITDLKARPARLKSGDAIPDRLFWMDDNRETVQSMANELQLRDDPWRLIAFFPDKIEGELLRKELLFGKKFGRETEDDIALTVFRVDNDYGQIRISVIKQEGIRK